MQVELRPVQAMEQGSSQHSQPGSSSPLRMTPSNAAPYRQAVRRRAVAVVVGSSVARAWRGPGAGLGWGWGRGRGLGSSGVLGQPAELPSPTAPVCVCVFVCVV